VLIAPFASGRRWAFFLDVRTPRSLTQSRVHQNPAAYNTEIPVRDAFVNLRTLPMSWSYRLHLNQFACRSD